MRRILLAVAWCVWGIGATAAGAAAEDGVRVRFAVIASPDVPIQDLEAREVRRLMLGERRFWKTNSPVTALMPNTGSQARDFLLGQLFRMTEHSYRRRLIEMMYRGELDYAPMVVGSADEAMAFASAGHGVITIVPADRLTNTAVHVLRIDGKRPGEPGYPLEWAPR